MGAELLFGRQIARLPFLFLFSLLSLSIQKSISLQLPKEISSFTDKLSRRDAILLGGGSILYGKVLSDAISRIGSGFYPLEHERRVSSTFKRAVLESSNNLYRKSDIEEGGVTSRAFRILEVGIGEDYRTIFSGNYDDALKSFFSRYPNQSISFTGLDYLDITAESKINSKVKKLAEANIYLQEHLDPSTSSSATIQRKVNFDIMQGDICESLPSIPDGYFDVVTCCLLLCSVADQEKALKEINRILRPNGGAFGYLEHVAVENEDFEGKSLTNKNPSILDLKLLEKEQIFFDPAQQFLAHGCHLHRSTESVIREQFNLQNDKGLVVENERFYVDKMWPVSNQACGVVIKSLSI